MLSRFGVRKRKRVSECLTSNGDGIHEGYDGRGVALALGQYLVHKHQLGPSALGLGQATLGRRGRQHRVRTASFPKKENKSFKRTHLLVYKQSHPFHFLLRQWRPDFYFSSTPWYVQVVFNERVRIVNKINGQKLQ